MVGFTYLYIDIIFAFYRYVDSFSAFTPLYFIVGCMNVIVLVSFMYLFYILVFVLVQCN